MSNKKFDNFDDAIAWININRTNIEQRMEARVNELHDNITRQYQEHEASKLEEKKLQRVIQTDKS